MENLQDKAIKIQGKDYILVVDRIRYFNETYKNGSITTELLSKPEDTHIVVVATVKPDSEAARAFTGHSQAVVGQGMVNKMAALENAETSAVGRALAMMGIGIIESLASADEMVKAGVTNKPVQDKNELPFDGKPTDAELERAFGPSEQKPPARTGYIEKVVGAKCPDCPNGVFVLNPKKQTIFCDQKCFLNK